MQTKLNPKISRKTHKIDASDKILGRLATEVSNLLRGKDKTNFVRHLDVGDFVEVYNVAKIRLTGSKEKQKKYYRHSGYIGSLKTITYKQLQKKDPTEPLRRAVYGMLPANKLRKPTLKRLKLYSDNIKESKNDQEKK